MPSTPDKFKLKKEPQQQRSRLLVDNICQATLSILNENGLSQLNTNSIAAKAGVDVASLYQFFPNKEAILFRIAEKWLGEFQSIYQRFSSDPALLALSWRDFFTRILHDWTLPDQAPKLRALQAFWVLYPEFKELENQQVDIHNRFFVEHFRRLNAKGSPAQWEQLSTYLFVVEDSISVAISQENPRYDQFMLDLYRDSFFFHAAKFLD